MTSVGIPLAPLDDYDRRRVLAKVYSLLMHAAEQVQGLQGPSPEAVETEEVCCDPASPPEPPGVDAESPCDNSGAV